MSGLPTIFPAVAEAPCARYRCVLPRAQAAQAGILQLLGREERLALHAVLLKLRAALDVKPAARAYKLDRR